MKAPNTEDNSFENARPFKITQTRVRNGVRVSKFLATFEGSKFDFRRFPYETGELRIVLNASRSRECAQILFNVNQESLPKGLNAHKIDYGVGDTKASSKNSKQILISVEQVNHARFAKLMVPLLTVLTISVAGLLVSPKNYEPRLGPGLIQSLSQASLQGLSAWVEVGGIAPSLCLKASPPQPIST